MITETLERIIKFMLWLLYTDYINESIKTTAYVKFLKWYVWVVFFAIICIDIGFYLAFILFDIFWMQWLMLGVAAGAGFYFGNEVRKIIRRKIGTHQDIYHVNISRLRSILIRRNIKTRNQIDLLLEQINEELPKLKTSEPLLKPIYSVSTIIIIPIILVIVKWVIDKNSNGIYLVILLVLITIMVASLYYMIKPLLEDLLDREYKRMLKLKQMLEDIRIIDDLIDKQSKIKDLILKIGS